MVKFACEKKYTCHWHRSSCAECGSFTVSLCKLLSVSCTKVWEETLRYTFLYNCGDCKFYAEKLYATTSVEKLQYECFGQP